MNQNSSDDKAKSSPMAADPSHSGNLVPNRKAQKRREEKKRRQERKKEYARSLANEGAPDQAFLREQKRKANKEERRAIRFFDEHLFHHNEKAKALALRKKGAQEAKEAAEEAIAKAKKVTESSERRKALVADVRGLPQPAPQHPLDKIHKIKYR